ncbi:PREDICTED: putative fatty acyl-CoA reductase CG8306 isoform X2 [Atta colombica]|uniref:putative fatty acyl-CoA reductase CG8306 isoform X2 n=1 Tax=Atta colombica TaxID=520822 RepID=UPI00084C472C|nr:PREDICTED: putative fatty acyl-CoA reductase CG8306 isoform X2 [Atta colombica]
MASYVTDFYNSKNIFITGGTGFVGVCLIEKLLRCCPDIKNIYLLMRSKKGKQIMERLEELTKNSVFNRIREEKQTDLFKKLIAIAGDVGEENLGLSSQDRTILIDTVEVVFHSAATLDFEADLKTTTNVNLLGTRRIVQLCREIKRLKVLVHVSSAYVNAVLHNVDEIIYPAPADINTILKLVDTLDDATLNSKTPEILKNHPNPYTFTKHLAEHEVLNGGFPATIVRPSMIAGAWKEPVPGWTISKNGPQGFILGASKGVIRRLPVAKHLIYDYIPVDMVVNSLIVAAYNVDRDRISAIFVHFIPAYILDAITRLCGGRPILVRLHTNVNRSLERLEKFIFQEWRFNNPRLLQLHESLSLEDQKLFTLDVRPLIWKDYFTDLIQGVRTYLHNESPKSLPKARSKHKILTIAHLGLQATLLGLIWWLVKILFATTWTKTGLVVPITYILFDQL